jgi:DegV family protein with EDD domain
MGVQVITDNVSDLPGNVVDALGIHVVPLKVSFGEEAGAENMPPDEFYARMVESDPLPTTSAPTPEEFAEVYRKVLAAGDEAVVVVISAALSATIDVANRAIELAGGEGAITVVDSTRATIAQGFVAVKAAEAAREGASREEVVAVATETIRRVGFVAAFDTLEYLRRGGRIGAARALLGSMLHIQPLVTLRNGIVAPYGRTRSRRQALEALVAFADRFTTIERLAIEHTACAEDAAQLKQMLADHHPGVPVYESRATPVIGTHTGPGLVVLSVLGDPGDAAAGV